MGVPHIVDDHPKVYTALKANGYFAGVAPKERKHVVDTATTVGLQLQMYVNTEVKFSSHESSYMKRPTSKHLRLMTSTADL
jgi:hypothetical protein